MRANEVDEAFEKLRELGATGSQLDRALRLLAVHAIAYESRNPFYAIFRSRDLHKMTMELLGERLRAREIEVDAHKARTMPR